MSLRLEDVPESVPVEKREDWLGVFNNVYNDTFDDTMDCELSGHKAQQAVMNFMSKAMKKIFIVGKNTSVDGAWEFQGVFSSEELAKAACLNSNYFVGPAFLDERLSDVTVDWEGSLRPTYG